MSGTNGGLTGRDKRNSPGPSGKPAPERISLTPLQAELSEDGIDPDPDLLNGDLARADVAPGAGYGVDGPEPLRGPTFAADAPLPRVFQWDIDPQDASAKSGTANIDLDGWEFHIWWQLHPADLIYVSIQAMREDQITHSGDARPHPVGRSEAVNLVYDARRDGVVAIYGTVKDFRPFVVAFHKGFHRSSERQGNTGPAGPTDVSKGES